MKKEIYKNRGVKFVIKSNIVHNNKYDYSEIKYLGYNKKVTIICPIHGKFEQTPTDHINGSGCQKCGLKKSKIAGKNANKKISTEDYIKRAIYVHGNKYDYNMVDAKNGYTVVKIICPLHGPFYTTMRDHTKGTGCRACKYISKAVEIHGNRYSYLYDGQTNIKQNFRIICPEHGEFIQSLKNHYRGKGCPNCVKKIFKSNKWFIEKSNKVHSNKYSYIFTNYIGSDYSVFIYCKKHGLFEQNAQMHLQGNGCKQCAYDETMIKTAIKHVKELNAIGISARIKKDSEYEVEVKCYLCKKWCDATSQQRLLKIESAYGLLSGESNIYCSDICKNSCPVFGFNPNNIDPRSKLYIEKTDAKMARNCQNNILKELQCEQYGYNYCEMCGDIIDVELHHTLPVAEYGLSAINPSGHMLLCAGCHTKLHSSC